METVGFRRPCLFLLLLGGEGTERKARQPVPTMGAEWRALRLPQPWGHPETPLISKRMCCTCPHLERVRTTVTWRVEDSDGRGLRSAPALRGKFSRTSPWADQACEAEGSQWEKQDREA